MNISTSRITNMVPPITKGGAMSGASSSCSTTAAMDVATCCNSMFSPSEFKIYDGLTTAKRSRRSWLPFHVTALLYPDLALTLHDPLRRGELGQAHRAAGVQLLRRNTHFGAQAQLAAVGEPRGRVHDDRCRIHLGDETLRVGEIVGQDRLRVAGGPESDGHH